MKKIVSVFLFTSMMLLFNINAQHQQDIQTQQHSSTVYVCTGNHATKYHSYSGCRGLNNCQVKVIAISKSTAINEYKRSACKICY